VDLPKILIFKKISFLDLDFQRVRNADIGISHSSMDSQAPKKEPWRGRQAAEILRLIKEFKGPAKILAKAAPKQNASRIWSRRCRSLKERLILWLIAGSRAKEF
jgi:hypothetical protein